MKPKVGDVWEETGWTLSINGTKLFLLVSTFQENGADYFALLDLETGEPDEVWSRHIENNPNDWVKVA